VRGKPQTHLPWDSWQNPQFDGPRDTWFHDIFDENHEPRDPSEVEFLRLIRKLD
jgi:hypothetical protein